MDRLNEAFDDAIEATDRAWDAKIAWVESQRRQLVPIAPGSHYTPLRPVSGPYVAAIQACHALEGNEVDRCVSAGVERHMRVLVQAYPMADLGDVSDLLRTIPAADPESLMVYSHNTRVAAWIEAKKAELSEAKRLEHDALEQRRAADLQRSARLRDAQVEAESRRRRQALATALGELGDSMIAAGQDGPPSSRPRPIAGSGPTVVAASASCHSDFNCGIGMTCVKANYSAEGRCLKTVNNHGTQQWNPPRSDSIGVKTPQATDCKFDTDCPIGFGCDRASGACVR